MSVRGSWTRIEAWLREHARYVLDSLNPGATAEAVRSAEVSLGLGRLPDDFAQSWLVHDGQNWQDRPQLVAGSLGSYALLPLERIVEHWTAWTDLLSSGTFDGIRGTPRGPVRADWWNRRWVPIGVNGVGDVVCLDLDPHPGGTIGQVIEVLHEDGDRAVLAPSLAAWLGEFAMELENEAYDPTHDGFYGLVHVRDLP